MPLVLPLPHPLDEGFPRPERGAELTAAIAGAGAGATISLQTGTYTGAFSITNKTNLTLKAAPGARAVITLRDTRFIVPNALWSTTATPDVWSIGEVIGLTVWRGKQKILVCEDDASFDQLVAAKIQCVRRLASSTLIYLEGANPNNTVLYISASDSAALACFGCTGLTLHGLNIWFGGAQGINFDDGNPCSNVLVNECTILGGKDAIRSKNGASSDMTYRRNWLVGFNDDRWYYRDVKGNANMEGSAIASGGTNQLAEENFVQCWFNGIGMGPPVAGTSVNCIVRRNAMIDLDDDAFEFDAKVDGGAIQENLLINGFVGWSFSPRQYNIAADPIVCDWNTLQCEKSPLEERDIPGSQFFGQATKLNSHPAGTAARYLTFTNNTVTSFNDTFRLAPSSQDTYPSDIIVTDNIISGRFGPIVRNTGSAAAGNSFQRNHYWLQTPGEFSRNFAVDIAEGQSISYATFALAKAGPEVTAAGWETTGASGDPLFAIPGQPSSLRKGTPVAAGRGAWTNRPFSISSVTPLATGWILIRGDGFDSLGTGLGEFENPIVVSYTTAFARALIRRPGGRRPW